MTSPIHSFLFSPPSSPPTRAADGFDPNHGLTSLKSLLLPTEFFPRSSFDHSSGLKPRSPRTPQNKYTLDVCSSSYPSRQKVFDVESTPVLEPITPRQSQTPREKKVFSSPPNVYQPSNVPSTPLPIPSSLPKPLLRLLFLASLLLSSILLLVLVPAARLPSLRAASISRRLALDTDGRAYFDLDQPVNSWSEARERDYKPPQIKASHMLRRAVKEKAAPAPHPRTKRPALIARPIPESHELIALQSYLLSSAYNTLPDSVDPQKPLDAHSVLGIGAHGLGPSGGQIEQAWLAELEAERHDEIVVWYGGNGKPQLPHEVLDLLSSIHGTHRHPTLMPLYARPDRSAILRIAERLSIPLKQYPVVMIGNEPLIADPEGLEELRLSGKLETMMAKVGWTHVAKKAWSPKFASVKKQELSEVEAAIKAAK